MIATLQPFPVADAWRARWIEPREAPNGPDAFRPAYNLATDFDVEAGVTSAVLHITAHGIYEAFLNGVRIGDRELTPGFTSYHSRLQVQTYDVTTLVHSGANALGALVSDGWWRGQHGIVRALNAYGSTTGLLAELHLALSTGDTVVIGTNEGWRSRPSHIRAADLIAGEIHDLRHRSSGWAEPGSDRSDWDSVVVADHPFENLVPTTGPPTRCIEELAAVSVTELAPGRHVVDFGQNSNGWIRLDDVGPAGTELTISYGEWLDPSGDLTQEHITHAAFAAPRPVPLPFQTDVVVSAGDGSPFEPHHSTKGFRYVRIEGHPGPLEPASITSIVVHSDLTPIGAFSCSDEGINRFYRAAVWSFRGNACEIPTDCPTRERSGWVGDWQLYVASAAELYDVADWSARWLLDLAADQLPSGAVTNIVPDPSPDAPIWNTGHGASGWGDAAVHVPWEIYRATGRTDILEAQFESMQRWVEFAARTASSGRHASRVQRNTEPLAHETYLWDSGWHFGEWLEPGTKMENVFADLLVADHGPVATAYLYRSADELARIASIINEPEAAMRYSRLAVNVLDAWRTEFLDSEGRVQPQTQANLVRALAFGLVPAKWRAQAAEDLIALIRSAGTHLGTGFLSTPFLLPVLTDHGYSDVAYELLLRNDEPSWLHMTEIGATTVWEDWDGVHGDGTASHSLNHYSKGAVISFLRRYVAGLDLLEPGYRRFRVAPRLGGAVTWAQTHHLSPYGRIEVAWSIDGATGRIDLTVPDETEAELYLPGGTGDVIGPGTHHRAWDIR
ncbi:MAG TPA: family 78 glycoside hydrolase catalytic domain [Acidimicrobiales bacterium]|jgi:alpha-L-rhamnosidase